MDVGIYGGMNAGMDAGRTVKWKLEWTLGWTLGWTLVWTLVWTLGGRYPKILERDGHGRWTGRSPKVDGMRSKSKDLLYGYG